MGSLLLGEDMKRLSGRVVDAVLHSARAGMIP